jgi:hypothetical protein
MRNICQRSREQDSREEFKTNLQSSCSDIITNLSNIGGLKQGLTLTNSEIQNFDELSGYSEQKSQFSNLAIYT